MVWCSGRITSNATVPLTRQALKNQGNHMITKRIITSKPITSYFSITDLASKTEFYQAAYFIQGAKVITNNIKQVRIIADYGIEYPIIGQDTLFETDLVRQLWLDNHFYGTDIFATV